MLELRASSGGALSGMRLRKERLVAPMMALKRKIRANCHGCGFPPRQTAANRKLRKLAKLIHAASRERYLPRTLGGTSAVIHGSQPALEMPRERLKPKSSIRMSPSRAVGSRNPDVSGTSA